MTNSTLIKPTDHVAATDCCDAHKTAPATGAVKKSKLEKTQSLLTVISTSIGLMGVAGSVFAMATATFYTGAVEVRPDADSPDVVVKVYTKEGHESTYHTTHIELMPGKYHLEISSNGNTVHADTKIRFHKTNTIPVHFPHTAQAAAQTAVAANTNPITSFFAPPTQAPNQNQQSQATSQQQQQQTQPAQSNSGQQTQSQAAVSPAVQSQQAAAQQLSFAKADLGDDQKPETTNESAGKKRRWWRFWQRNPAEADDSSQIE